MKSNLILQEKVARSGYFFKILYKHKYSLVYRLLQRT